MQISFCVCLTCTYLKILENIQISVNMIDRLDITDEYSLNKVILSWLQLFLSMQR